MFSFESLAELVVYRGCAGGMVFLGGGERSLLCWTGFGARTSLKSWNCPGKNGY